MNPVMLNLFDSALSLTLRVPAEWTVTASEQFPLDIYAPRQEGYRASLGLLRAPIATATRESFSALIAQRHAELARDLPGFTPLHEEQCWIDELPASVLTYRWLPLEEPRGFTQIAAVLLSGPATIVEVHAAALTPLAATYLPLFETMLRSLRVISVQR